MMDRKILSVILRGVDITETYSPDHVATTCRRFGLTPGSSMDLATGYDFSKPADRRRAWNKVMTEEPYILIGGLPHTLLSQLRKIDVAKYESDPAYNLIEQVKQHIRFCCVLYRIQLSKGRIFLHEHPRLVASWNLDCIANLLRDPRVERAAGFVSSSWCILEELSLN